MPSDHPIQKRDKITLPNSVIPQPILNIPLSQLAAHHRVIYTLLIEPNRAACAIANNPRNLRQQLSQPPLFSRLREDDRYIEAALEVLPHCCHLRRCDLLDDLIIWKFLLAVFWDEELIAMGVLESLDVGDVLLVDRDEP